MLLGIKATRKLYVFVTLPQCVWRGKKKAPGRDNVPATCLSPPPELKFLPSQCCFALPGDVDEEGGCCTPLRALFPNINCILSRELSYCVRRSVVGVCCLSAERLRRPGGMAVTWCCAQCKHGDTSGTELSLMDRDNF